MGVDKHDARRERRTGMAMVEMVIVAPLLLGMIFAIAEFGVMFGQWQTLTNAAREGARLAIVFRNPCVVGTVQTDAETAVQNYAAGAGLTIPTSDISIAGQCGVTDSTTTVTVTFAYQFTVLPNFSGSVNPTWNLVGTSTMRNEG